MKTSHAVLPISAAVLAAIIALPATAQVGGVTAVGAAPGVAAGYRTMSASATVAAIDMATRQVTLRRTDGTTFTIVAGPEVRNLAQVRVGDVVSIDYVDTLTLELKKGGTGAPASIVTRSEAARTELGQRPGSAAAKETTIVADVIAVDPANQRVSLRGPRGNVVVLPVRERAQFNLIKVGDQVEATYVEAVALAVTPATMAAAPMAMAYPRWIIGVRSLGIYPDDNSSIPGLSVKEQWTGEVDFTYFWTKNFATELIAAWAKHEVKLNGASLGKVGVLPPTLTFQWHFTDLGPWKPYVGAGINYTYFYEDKLANDTLKIKDSSWGGALQAGMDYMFNRNWSVNVDVKYIWMDTEVKTTATGAKIGDLDIDPWLFGIGLRYRF